MPRRTIKIPKATGAISRGEARATALALSGSRRATHRATPTRTLAAVVGSSSMPRAEVARKIWGYIRRNGLIDKKTGAYVSADRKLKPVFGGKSHIRTTDVGRLVSKHLK